MIFAGLFAKIGASLFFGRVKSIAKAVPRKVWIGLAVVILLLIAFWFHQRHANAMLEAAHAEGYQQAEEEWQDAFDKMKLAAGMWRENYESKSNALSELERTRHEEELRSNAALADALRLRGPGRAATCIGSGSASGLPLGPSIDGTASGGTDVTGPGVPADEWAAVPWGWLVTRAEEHDANRDEVIRWRNWYQIQLDLYNTEREALTNSGR